MAVTVDSSGTQAATVNTEHTLDDVAAPGTYQLGVDMTNMAAGDVVELRFIRCSKLAVQDEWCILQVIREFSRQMIWVKYQFLFRLA
jgi:hypothetical protein